MREIRVNNNYPQAVHVTVAEEKKRLVESKDATSLSVSTETSLSVSTGISVGEVCEKGSSSQSKEQIRKHEWSPSIEAGEVVIESNSHHIFKIHRDDPIFYLTVRVGTNFFYNKSQETDEEITIDEKGNLNKIGSPIKSGEVIFLQYKEGGRTIGEPIKEMGWPCARVDDTNGEHKIVLCGKENETEKDIEIADRSIVRIECKNERSAGEEFDGYNTMFCEWGTGYIYYGKRKEADASQKWQILKTEAKSNSRSKFICIGDEVVLRSRKNTNESMYVYTKNNNEWVACDSGKGGSWIIKDR
jgi:hypothetical protein